MPRRRSILAATATAVAFFAAALGGVPPATTAAAATTTATVPRVGQPAPDFAIRTADGQVTKLADLKGQVVLINFWATWCGPCRAELPTLDAYYRAQSAHGMKAFAVTTEDSLPAYRLKALGAAMAMPLVKGIRGPYAPVGGAVPTNFVIDRAGIVRYARAGAFDLDALNALLVPLLNEPPPQ